MNSGKTSALTLCILLISTYTLQVTTGFQPGFVASESVWWTFFTSFFGHSDVEHLTNNLFFIGLFGTVYTLATDSKTFWTTFLVSAVGANLTAFIFYTDSAIIGASGGAMGILSALTAYKPRQTGLALGVPAPMYAVLGVYLLINFAGITAASQVAYEAHLFGLLTGVIIGLNLRRSGTNPKNQSQYGKSRETKHEKTTERQTKHGKTGDQETEDRETTDNEWDEKIRSWEQKYMFD